MKKILSILTIAFAIAISAQAQVHLGVRGGYNITKMSFDNKLLSADNNAGFYLGPTLKVDLPLNLALDMSLLYDQRDADAGIYVANSSNPNDFYEMPSLTRKVLAVPLNLRLAFGLGSAANVFVFAGPEFDFSLNKDVDLTDFEWSWNTSTYSVNVGAGIFLANHFELKVNYNIPCSDSGSFNFEDAYNKTYDGISGKTGAWQIGAAVYF